MKMVKLVPFMSEIGRVEAATVRFKFLFNVVTERLEVSFREYYIHVPGSLHVALEYWPDTR